MSPTFHQVVKDTLVWQRHPESMAGPLVFILSEEGARVLNKRHRESGFYPGQKLILNTWGHNENASMAGRTNYLIGLQPEGQPERRIFIDANANLFDNLRFPPKT